MATRAKANTDRALRVAWAAGFLDGEGYVGLSRGISNKKTGRPFHQAIIDAAQKHRAPLEELVDLFGGRVRVGKNWCGAIFYWRITGKVAHPALVELLPYLLLKHQQASLLIEFCRTLSGSQGRRISDELLARREAMHAELRFLNRRRRPSHAERLSEKAPVAQPEDATVRSHGNGNHEKQGEIPARLRVVGE